MKITKIVSSLMAMAMAVASMSVVANAADVQVKVGSASVEAGESFKVTVDLASVPSSGINAVDFAIGYDSSVIKISKVSVGDAANTGAAAAEGSELGDTVFSYYDTGSQLVLIWATGVDSASNWITKDGTFVTIEGTAIGEAGSSTDLTVEAVKRAAYPGSNDKNSDIVLSAAGSTDYGCSATKGSVTIGKAASEIKATLYGDVNNDGDVNINDVILLSRYVNEDAAVKSDVTEQGAANANCCNPDDDALNAADVTAIIESIAKLCTLPVKK